VTVPHLSRIWLNPLRTGAQRLIRNPQAMHATVLGGLARQPVDERVLWRLELQPHRGELLVLTETRPSWEHVIEQAGWTVAEEPQAMTVPYDGLLGRLVSGAEFAFRLRANPTSSRRHPDSLTPSQAARAQGRRGVVVPHTTAAAQTQWLLDHLPSWGFSAVELADGNPAVGVTGRERLAFSRERGAPRVILQTATYDGRLRVDDVELARTSLMQGVGRGRAYGCGLITLAPAV